MRSAHPSDGLAWVTGASTGIGAALVAALVGAGWQVVATARGAELLAELAAAHPGQVIAAPGDITDAVAMREIVARVQAQTGRNLALAVFNAGTWQEMGAQDFDLTAFRRQIEVNLNGTAACLAAVMPGMIARHAGQIAIVASVAGYRGLPRGGAYGASKAAVDSLSKSAALAWAPHGITVNTIAPGRMTGGMVDALDRDLARVTGQNVDELIASRTKTLPMGRRVDPAEVAQAVIWLASDDASYVTGERFNFTGGQELQ